jgi:acyl dehydratase
MSVARWKRMFDINVIGSLICAREAVRRMSTLHGGEGGSIVNVSSAASRLGAPGQYVDYAAAKGAIDAFTLGLAKEVAAEGVRVNAVRPGLIDTEIHASGGLPNRVKDLQHLVPAGRGGSAEEVAEGIVWLLSDAEFSGHFGRPVMAHSPTLIKYYWEDMAVDQVRDLGSITPTREEVIAFASQFDPQPFHLDDEAAKASVFGALSASGWHTCAMAMRLMVTNFLCETSSLGSPGLEGIKWLKPVYPNDTLRLQSTVLETKSMSKRPDVGMTRNLWEMFNQHGDKVLHMEGWGMFRRRTPAA